ncbi:RluA family pseudouridine synthase [Anaeromyxobacter diazotrophicus]|uniref:Pseudouridine synthase n=1 Tax=Anaeromyxobacter diazotrophicus TaxID=2590199 RepID=A0A7I9VP88_9BACT|nr:RluA family pseudouridine synthase [Anaeromyxobacter diazotrophicus]GEJ58222.1 pseudouridine synthase [Anaeromyxobacter diazotrophicus]
MIPQTAAEKLLVPGEDAGERLDRFLARALSVQVERARALVAQGRVRIRGRTCSPHRKLFGGEEVEVTRPAPRAAAAAADEPALAALFDDPDCLVVDKPAGLPVEPARPGAPSAVGAASRLGRFDVAGRALPGLAHRLDRDTSGCLLLARHDRALAALKGAFEAGRVEKSYLALVAGTPPDEGRLDTPYARDPADPRRFTGRVASARRARLRYRVRERLRGAALVEVRLETGRTHQIRVQLSEAGYPVLGDAVYGVAAPGLARQALHAWRLAFPAPSGAAVAVEAPVPADLARAVAALREEPRG